MPTYTFKSKIPGQPEQWFESAGTRRPESPVSDEDTLELLEGLEDTFTSVTFEGTAPNETMVAGRLADTNETVTGQRLTGLLRERGYLVGPDGMEEVEPGGGGSAAMGNELGLPEDLAKALQGRTMSEEDLQRQGWEFTWEPARFDPYSEKTIPAHRVWTRAKRPSTFDQAMFQEWERGIYEATGRWPNAEEYAAYQAQQAGPGAQPGPEPQQTVQQMIAERLSAAESFDMDDENFRQAQALFDFQQQPTQMQLLDKAMQVARSPGDLLVLMNLYRGREIRPGALPRSPAFDLMQEWFPGGFRGTGAAVEPKVPPVDEVPVTEAVSTGEIAEVLESERTAASAAPSQVLAMQEAYGGPEGGEYTPDPWDLAQPDEISSIEREINIQKKKDAATQARNAQAAGTPGTQYRQILEEQERIDAAIAQAQAGEESATPIATPQRVIPEAVTKSRGFGAGQYGKLPKFDRGGTVRGNPGKKVLAQLEVGETVRTPFQEAKLQTRLASGKELERQMSRIPSFAQGGVVRDTSSNAGYSLPTSKERALFSNGFSGTANVGSSLPTSKERALFSNGFSGTANAGYSLPTSKERALFSNGFPRTAASVVPPQVLGMQGAYGGPEGGQNVDLPFKPPTPSHLIGISTGPPMGQSLSDKATFMRELRKGKPLQQPFGSIIPGVIGLPMPSPQTWRNLSPADKDWLRAHVELQGVPWEEFVSQYERTSGLRTPPARRAAFRTRGVRR